MPAIDTDKTTSRLLSRLFGSIAAIVWVTLAGPVASDPLTVYYAGELNTLNDPDGLLPGVGVGATFTGSDAIDSNLFSLWGPIVNDAIRFAYGPGSVEVDVGGDVYSQRISEIWIAHWMRRTAGSRLPGNRVGHIGERAAASMALLPRWLPPRQTRYPRSPLRMTPPLSSQDSLRPGEAKRWSEHARIKMAAMCPAITRSP